MDKGSWWNTFFEIPEHAAWRSGKSWKETKEDGLLAYRTIRDHVGHHGNQVNHKLVMTLMGILSPQGLLPIFSDIERPFEL